MCVGAAAAAGLPAKTTPEGLGYSIDRQKEEKDDGRVNRNANTKTACLIVEQQTIVSFVSNSYVGSNLREIFLHRSVLAIKTEHATIGNTP